MSSEPVMHAVRDIFREQLSNPAIELRADMESGALDGWDSFANVEILLACEARWNIRFSAAEIDRIRSVGDLVRSIEAKIA